jgi:hypothetical protein
MTVHQHPSRAGHFEQETADAVARLRGVLARWIASLDSPVTTASELKRATRLDMKLCWKVFRVLESPDALAAALYVPGSANLRALERCLRRSNATGQLADDLATAAQRLAEVVQHHAGDRQTFETMISPWTGEQEEKLQAGHRRAAFRANRHIWGLQADAQLSCYIFCTSRRDPAMIDGALLTSMVGLRRLRHTTAPLFSQLVGISDDDGVIRRPLTGEPLDPENCGELGLSIVRAFCSENLPRIITHHTSDGFVHATLPNEMVGLRGAVTITTGHLTPALASRYRHELNLAGHHTVFIQTPVRSLFLDVIFEDGTFGDAVPHASVYADRTGRLPFPTGDQRANLLSASEPVVRLGRGTRVLHTPALARYPELAALAMERLSLDPQRCTAYRCRIDFPVMLSRAVVSFPLPERPTA